jgi:hypothetical protein
VKLESLRRRFLTRGSDVRGGCIDVCRLRYAVLEEFMVNRTHAGADVEQR